MIQSAASLATDRNETVEPVCLPPKVVREAPVSIDTILTEEEFLALIEHMGNRNPLSHFLVIWRDDDGNPRYAKAKPHKRADVQARWTWDTITGVAKQKTSMGLYPKNQANHSTWAALDFDAHSGDDNVAKDWALKAFSRLREYQDCYMLLSASGRGYHVFIFSPEARPIAEWANLLKHTCEVIGVPILDGVCELFPSERTEKQEVGRAIRVPGSFNPSTGNAELIVAETIRPLVDRLMLTNAKKPADSPLYQPKRFHLRKLTETREADNSSSCIRPFFSTSTDRLIQEALAKHPIKAKSTRNSVLIALIGELCHKFGRQLSEQIVRQHYHLYKENVTTPLKEHMREFTAAWGSVLNKSIKSLSQPEREIFDQLKTEPQREAFLIIRSFSKVSGYDFPVALASMADRLSITKTGASCVISKLAGLGAIEKTTDARINSKSARYRWTANIEQPF